MSQAVEDMLDGLICQICGQFIDFEASGYPRPCDECEKLGEDDEN